MYAGVAFLYVTLFSSNICRLVISYFMLHNKHIYFIVVPDICCSKIPQHAHVFFWSALRLDPCPHPTRYLSSKCNNGIIQVLWLSIMIMFQLHHQREAACHSQPSVITICHMGVGGGSHLTAVYSKTYHPNSCQTSHVRYFRASPVCWHVCFRDSTPVSTRLPGERLLLCQTIWQR